MDDEDELTRLRARVAVLEDALARLLELLVVSGGLSHAQRDRLRFPPPSAEAPRDVEPPALREPAGGSPYRDGPRVATPGAMQCNSCGKWLAADDPELSLASRGRVCTSCFVRGG